MRVLILSVFLAAIGFSAAAFAADAGDAILGAWLTDGGASKVQILDTHGVYSGHVVWLQAPTFPVDDPGDMAGKPKVDRLNSDTTLRSRPIMGLTVLTGLHYAGNDVWEGGTIYSPATGKSYGCKVALTPDRSLKITVGSGMFSRTSTWTKASSTP